MDKTRKKKNLAFSQFVRNIRIHRAWGPVQQTERACLSSMYENFIKKRLRKMKLADNMIVLSRRPVSRDLNDKTASVVAAPISPFIPKLLIQVVEHGRLGEAKKKYMCFRKRFPMADLFIYEYGSKKGNRWEFGTQWHKLTKDGQFVKGDNHSDWLGTDIEENKAVIKEMKDYMESENMEAMRIKIMWQIANFVESNSGERNKEKILEKDNDEDINMLSFGEVKEGENGKKEFVTHLIIKVVPHENYEEMKEGIESNEWGKPQIELLVFEFATKKRDRWVYSPQWHRFEKGEWKDTDGYCERIGKKIELDEKEFL